MINDGDEMKVFKEENGEKSTVEMVSQEGTQVDMVPETQIDNHMAIKGHGSFFPL